MAPSIAESTDPTAFDLDLDLVVEGAPPLDVDLADLERLIRFVLAAEESRGRWAVAVVLTDDERLRALHRDFMGLDTPTDVMTFPLADDAAPSHADRGGDVVVSVERAAAQAGDFGQTTAQEVRFLVVHGLLHLCGWDDAGEGDRVRMLERQTALIAAFEAAPR
jgi:probable rRNA maturation factor